MSEQQTEARTDVSLLQQAVTLFLKEAMPDLSLDACADAVIRSVTRFIPTGIILASLWHPGQRPNTRIRLKMEGDTIVHHESAEPEAPVDPAKDQQESTDDVRILWHRSLKTLTSDRPAVEDLQGRKLRAAIEIRFCYFGRLVLLLIIGLPGPKGMLAKEAQEFLSLFCRCCLISIQGAYIAEMEERSGRSNGLLVHEKFSLTLQWFHSVARHLTLGAARLQAGEYQQAADALERTTVVAGVCLAEIIGLMKTGAGGTPVTPLAPGAPVSSRTP